MVGSWRKKKRKKRERNKREKQGVRGLCEFRVRELGIVTRTHIWWYEDTYIVYI